MTSDAVEYTQPKLANSPFQHALGTNFIPSEPEVDQIRAHLSPHEAELTRIGSLIASLEIQRSRMASYILPHRALISSPRRIPPEILEQIFTACLPTERNAVMNAAEAPLLLGRICSSWRATAFEAPRLWTSLHIPVEFVTTSRAKMTAMSEWLNRSDPYPLYLSIETTKANPRKVLDSLSRLSPRLSLLHVSGISATNFSLLADMQAPHLAEVSIHFAGAFNPYVRSTPTLLCSPVFQSTPSGLQRIITIAGRDLDALFPRNRFTWAHLTHLRLIDNTQSQGEETYGSRSLSCNSLHRLLSNCPHLISLDVNATHLEPLSSRRDRIVVPTLQSLTIRLTHYARSSSETLAYLLCRLELPQLITLHLPSLHLEAEGLGFEFLMHISEFSPQLQDFELGTPAASFKSTLEEIQRLLHPNLRRLSLAVFSEHSNANEFDLFSTPNNILEDITPHTEDHDPFPGLETLEIHGGLKIADSAWQGYVEANLQYGTSLRRFSLSSFAPLQINPHCYLTKVEVNLCCLLANYKD
ncbi:hypothetical protein R3P38DRAFT_3113697 [Favolaschia claudopus]|uniref:F-box domain-containing protein n=1 Tax=Favolaschia claudopus TaxID=2862362 RepID=A0AAV9ZHQ7_9AGAR